MKTTASSALEKQLKVSDRVMKKKVTDFPFESARRITADEIAEATIAVKEQFGIEPPKRGRPALDEAQRYEPVSIQLHPKVIEWAKKEAQRR